MWRHGDVIIAAVTAIPQHATARPAGVLARGEATGHSHRLQDARSADVLDADGVGYLRVSADFATIVHEEHSPIQLPRGVYKFWQQREYSPTEIRTVVD